MQVKDVGFVSAAEIVRAIEINAGLIDVNYNAVHTYKISRPGLKRKKAVKELLEVNQRKLAMWVGGNQRSEEMVTLARSMYKTNNIMIAKCVAHIETISNWLKEQQGEL